MAAALLLAGCGSAPDPNAGVVSAAQTAPAATPLPPTTAPLQAPTVVPTTQPTPVVVPTVEPIVEPSPVATVAESTSAPTVPTVPITPTAAPAAPATAAPATTVPAPTRPPAPSSPSNSNAILVANGGEIYTLNCARCHGESGLGSAQYSGLVGVGNKYSTAGMIEELTNGHPVTFGFADRLSAEEIESVVAYVKATFP